MELAKNKFNIGQKVYWSELTTNKVKNKIYQLILCGRIIKIERSIERINNGVNTTYLYIIMPYKKNEKKLHYILENKLHDNEQDAFNKSHVEKINQFIENRA